jgi:lipid-binding SYLF domain-containing protein
MEVPMNTRFLTLLFTLLMALPLAPALADDYADTVKVFRNAGQSGKFFGTSYGYAVFPTIGLQLGGQAYSQIIFFQDKRAFDEFTGGNFEFGAQATAVAITAGAQAQAGTSGTGAGASGTQKHATTAGGYQKGMAIFTVAKGGLMYEASISGQKFSYKKK